MKKTWKKWPDQEIILLKAKFYLPRQELQNLFSNRTWQSITQKSHQLKLPRIQYRVKVHYHKRFWKYVKKEKNGCWIWTGAKTNAGYGSLTVNKKACLTYRLSFEMHCSKIPDNKQLDHLCRNRACVNPKHLEVVTSAVNILRGTSPSAVNARKTHCPKGHLYDNNNTYITPQGARVCKRCRETHKQKFQNKCV